MKRPTSHTTPGQFYRLLDPTYYGKSVGQMLALLHILGLEVEVVVTPALAPAYPLEPPGRPYLPNQYVALIWNTFRGR